MPLNDPDTDVWCSTCRQYGHRLWCPVFRLLEVTWDQVLHATTVPLAPHDWAFDLVNHAVYVGLHPLQPDPVPPRWR